ncbi:MAG: RDD family protein [Nannocystaceae bacterium]
MNRIQALFFDVWIIIGILMFLSSTFFEDYEGRFVGLKIIVFFALLLIYEPLANMTGGTIGYRTMGMKIRRFGDLDKKLSFTQAFGRSILKLVSRLDLFIQSQLTLSAEPCMIRQRVLLC